MKEKQCKKLLETFGQNQLKKKVVDGWLYTMCTLQPCGTQKFWGNFIHVKNIIIDNVFRRYIDEFIICTCQKVNGSKKCKRFLEFTHSKFRHYVN